MMDFQSPMERWNFVVGAAPRAFSKNLGWTEVRAAPLTAAEWRDLAHELLLTATSGVRRLNDSWYQAERIGQQILVSKLDFNAPAVVPENPALERFFEQKKSGLALLVTQDIAGLICFVAPKVKALETTVFISNHGVRREMWDALRAGESVGGEMVRQLPFSATLVVDLPLSSESLTALDDRIDEGQKVIWFISGKSLLGGYAKWIRSSNQSRYAEVKAAENLEILANFVSSPHPDTNERQFFMESLALSAATRENMRNERLGPWLESVPSEYGSLNQALIQGLLKRRLNLRTAFELSTDPATLDSELKRIGF